MKKYFLFLVLMLGLCFEGHAQSADAAGYEALRAEFTAIENSIKNDDFTRQSLDEAFSLLSEEDMALEIAAREVEKEAKPTEEALARLPQGEENEDPAIAGQRQKYTAELKVYKSRLVEINLLKTEIVRLQAMVAEARSRIVIGNLVAEKNTIITPSNFFGAINDATVFLWQVAKSPVDWYLGLDEAARNDFLVKIWYVLLILALALSLGLYLRNFIIRRWGYLHTDDPQPRYGEKIVAACATVVAYGVIPSMFIGGCLLWQLTNEVLTHSKFGAVLASVLYYSLFMILIRALSRVILAPWNGRWRLFNITDARAEKVFKALTLIIIMLGTAECLRHIAAYFEPSERLKLLLEVIIDAFKASAIILMTASIFGEIKPKEKEESEVSAEGESGAGESAAVSAEVSEEDEGVGTSFKIIFGMSLFAIFTLGLSLFGYPNLATFIFNRFFFSVVFVAVFVMVKKLVSDLLRRSIVFWIKTFKMRRRLLSKADFVMSLLITPVLVMLLLYSLLRLWGVPGNFMLQGLKKLVFGFKVGGIQVSLIAIAAGCLVFLVSLTMVRLLKRRLAVNLLNRINMDEGIKHSLVSGFGFIGFVISTILAIITMGVDLSNLAIIAGALSVGIGFGLQDVIKNLVSGIIILFERPFKVGDWVILGGEEGKIKQINIRSTELETFTRRSVIIPNATLISSSLVNLTHGNAWQRQALAVGVSYDSDADLVTNVLLECAKANKKIVKVPAPYVVFKDFGASSLDFELRFYVSDIWSGWSASSELRYEILRRFREENINIAYPQIVVHQSSEDTSVKGWQSNS